MCSLRREEERWALCFDVFYRSKHGALGYFIDKNTVFRAFFRVKHCVLR